MTVPRAAATAAATALAVVAALGAPGDASAEPVPEKARRLAERGRELHDRGDYTRAIIAFKEAYVIAPSPGLLFNLAQAYRLQGNCDDAALMYRRYISAGPSPEQRALADAHLATVVRCTQRRNLNLPMDASMARFALPPPPTPEQQIFAEPGPPEDRSSGQLSQRVGIGVAAGGALAVTIGAYYGVCAYGAARDVEKMYAEGAKWRDIEPIHLRGERAETAARWLAIGGGAAAIAGATLYVLGKRAERTAAPMTLAPTKGGAVAGMSWAF